VYDARCLLIGLEMLSDRKIVASALFARDILFGWVDCADLALLIRFEEIPYSRQRNAGLLKFFHRTNGRFEPVNNTVSILINIVTGSVVGCSVGRASKIYKTKLFSFTKVSQQLSH
jgi:hypothetical protein